MRQQTNPRTISYFVSKHQRSNFWPSLRSATIDIKLKLIEINSIFRHHSHFLPMTMEVQILYILRLLSKNSHTPIANNYDLVQHDKYQCTICIGPLDENILKTSPFFDFEWEFWFPKFNERNQTENMTQHYCLTWFAFTLEYRFCYFAFFHLHSNTIVVKHFDIFGFDLLDIHGSLTPVWILNSHFVHGFRIYSLFNHYTVRQTSSTKWKLHSHIFYCFCFLLPKMRYHAFGHNVEIGNSVIIHEFSYVFVVISCWPIVYKFVMKVHRVQFIKGSASLFWFWR